MEFARLATDRYTNPLTYSHDSCGPLELTAPPVLWTNNCTASSQLWPLEFVAAKTRIFIVDISSRGAGKIRDTIDLVSTPPGLTASNPWWNTSPRGVTFLRLCTLLGREVLLATADDGSVYVWRTLALSLGEKRPWFEYKAEDSAWGVDAHKSEPLLAISDNSGRITLLALAIQPDGSLELSKSVTSPYLGGNIPCVSFVQDYIAYTMLTLDLLAGSFGVVGLDLQPVYSVKMQQAGWCVQPVGKAFVEAHTAADLCGAQTMPEEFQLVECRDACDAGYILDLDTAGTDRLGFRQRWIEPQTWVKEQQLEIKEWIKHGRRKPPAQRGPPQLKDEHLLVTTSTHGFLVEAASGKCLVSAERALLPPGVVPSEEFCGLALSIVEYIEPLGVAIVVSRAATVVCLRLTERHNMKSMRQELVLCDFHDFIVGVSSCPARAHDFEYDLRHLDLSTEATWTHDVPDKTLGDIGTYLVRLHTKEGGVEAFLVSAEGVNTGVSTGV